MTKASAVARRAAGVAILVAAAAMQSALSFAAPQSVDYQFFKSRVEPIFLKKREGHARCYVCHAESNTGFSLERLSASSAAWTEEQSRHNFESASRLVIPGDPTSSRLLMHPLAHAAGGDPYHAGGRQFTSQDDPDWLTLAEWVRGGPAGAPAQAASAAIPASTLDFQVYKSSVEPIFLKEREDGVRCYNCHSVFNTRLRLQVLAPGNTSWTEEQSRLNFQVVTRLVTPGEPLKSRLLLHPLAPEAGGDPFHTGGKFWKSQDDPEWKIVAAWVGSAPVGTSAPEAGSGSAGGQKVDFAFFEARVEPIFLKKREGHARCYVCHAESNTGFHLERLAEGSTTWTEEQSRRNFETASQLVVPGDPASSRLLMHPLAHAAGGDPYHAGGRQFTSQDDPDWLTMAEWVRGQKGPDLPGNGLAISRQRTWAGKSRGFFKEARLLRSPLSHLP